VQGRAYGEEVIARQGWMVANQPWPDWGYFFELKVELEPQPALGQASPLFRTKETEHERI